MARGCVANLTEVQWLTQVARLDAALVPAVLASDGSLAAFAMEYLPPDRHELWKSQLARGCVIPETAANGGPAARIDTRGLREIADGLPRFRYGRFVPRPSHRAAFLLATARAHPDLASVLEALAERCERTKLTVVHGDVSPKNIVLGPRGPIFLDAECAWFGDPAFDLAFCLNHLLLTLWIPSAERELLTSFDTLAESYLRGVDWEPAATLEQRAARLLPALFLARVDGKSPVEYLTDDASKNTVRHARDRCCGSPTTRSVMFAAYGVTETLEPAASVPAHGDRIDTVIGRRVWDSRGRPTVEAEVVLATNGRAGYRPGGCVYRCQRSCRSQGHGRAFAGLGVDRAVRHVSAEIVSASRSVGHGSGGDRPSAHRPRRGRQQSATGRERHCCAVDGCAARRGCARCRRRYLAGDAQPMPDADGADFRRRRACGRRVDIQDFLVVSIGASTFDEAISMAVRIYESAGGIMAERGALRGVADEGGWWPEFSSNSDALDTLLLSIERAALRPGIDAAVAIVAASQLRNGSRYRFAAENRELTSDELIGVLLEWCRRYSIVSVEDPLAQDDHDGMRSFTAQAGNHA